MTANATMTPPERPTTVAPAVRPEPSFLPAITVVGALLTAVTATFIHVLSPVTAAIPWGTVVGLVAVMGVLGVVGRGVRRAVFFGDGLSLHQALSFDVLFQGITTLNPQVLFPDTEREFVRRETGLPAEDVTPWFGIRRTSALVIPAGLAAAIGVLAGTPLLGAAFAAIALVILGIGGTFGARRGRDGRVLASVAVGCVTTAIEAGLFVLLARALVPTMLPWHGLLTYAVLLTAFELSPVPLALGVLEVCALLLLAIPGVAIHAALPLLYRVARLVPVLLGTSFYLARYKLTLADVFDPTLALALARTRRPDGGWQPADGHDGPRLSIVIPAYNEAERLPLYLEDVVAFARDLEGGGEVLVVDDGSSDGTVDYVRSIAEGVPELRLLIQETNQGKGAAVRRGMLEADGRFVLFADADGATPIDEAKKLLAVAETGVEVVIASRKASGDDAERDISVFRALLGATFYRLTNLLAVPGVSDTQCGFKLFHRAAARRIFPMAQEDGWAFDVELLFLAQKIGMAIAEVPVNWTAIDGSKVNPIKDAIKMFIAIWRIRRKSAGLVPTLEGATP